MPTWGSYCRTVKPASLLTQVPTAFGKSNWDEIKVDSGMELNSIIFSKQNTEHPSFVFSSYGRFV